MVEHRCIRLVAWWYLLCHVGAQQQGKNEAHLETASSNMSCVSDEVALRLSVETGGIVYLCGGSNIVLSRDILIGINGTLDVRCDNAPRYRNGTIPTCTLSGNHTTRILTGVYPMNLAVFRDIIFENGKASTGMVSGGAIDWRDGALELERCTFVNNFGLNGGAISAGYASVRVTIRDCLFDSNYGWHCGGALYLYSRERAFVFNTTFRSNKSISKGSALYLESSHAVIQESVIQNNTITWSNTSAALHCRWCDAVLLNTTFRNNGEKRDVHLTNDTGELWAYTYVFCDRAQRVNFCQGLEGIDTWSPWKTNCQMDAVVNASSAACS